MEKAGPAAGRGPVLDVGAARLEVLAVGAGGDLAVARLPRQPDLEVVGLRRREPHVAGGQRHDPVGKPEPAEHGLRGLGEHLELRVAGLRRGEVDELDLVELVLADQAAHVAAVGAGLGAEARRVGAVAARQRRLLEDLAAVQVGHRHLGGRDEVEVGSLDVEEVGLELGQLAGADQRRRG